MVTQLLNNYTKRLWFFKYNLYLLIINIICILTNELQELLKKSNVVINDICSVVFCRL